MNFLSLIEMFGPLADQLATQNGDEQLRIDPSVVAELEAALETLKGTVDRVQAIRDTRVDTSEMSISELDKLIREGM